MLLPYRTPQNETLLLIAIRHQLEKVADKLCEMGVDLSMADTQGNSPLWVALRSRQETIATKLVHRLKHALRKYLSMLLYMYNNLYMYN